MIRRFQLLLLAFVIVTLSHLVLAQQNATLTGSVYDQAGKGIPGVQVTLSNSLIGFSRSTATDAEGTYTFTNVPPLAGYILSASAPNRRFQSISQDIRVQDTVLTIPPIREEVTSAGTPGPSPATAPIQPVRLDSIATSTGTVISSSELSALPLYNRNFLALGLLVAGTHDIEAGSPLAGSTFSVSGARPTFNNFLLDGMDNVASSSNQAIPFQVNDAIQEFRVTTGTPSAEFGRNSGGVVNVVTHRATSGFHGSVFGYFGADALNAGDPLSVYSGSGFDLARAYAGPLNAAPLVPTPCPGVNCNQISNGGAQPIYLLSPSSYNQYVATAQQQFGTGSNARCTTPGLSGGDPNCYQRFNPDAILAANNSYTQPFSSQQFGANAGGSLFKNKLYVFGDYEGTRIDNPNPIFERVPSAFDKTQVAGLNSTDAKIAQGLLSLYPQPNVVGIPGALEFYKGQAPNYTNVDNYLARLDFNQSDKSTWTARYNIQDLHQLHDDSLPSGGIYPGNGADRSALNQSLTVSFLHTFSSHLTNEVRGGFSRFQLIETPQDQNFNASSIGLPGGDISTFLLGGIDPRYSGASQNQLGAYAGWINSYWHGQSGSTGISVAPTLDGLFPYARVGAPLSAPGQRRDTMGYVADNVSLIHGQHSLRFGGEYRHLQNIFINDAFMRGLVVSGNIGEFTNDSESCINLNGVCGLNALGAPVSAFTSPSFDYALRQPLDYRGLFNSYGLSFYAQDSYRITGHLTLNYGLRYEHFSAPNETNNQIWNYQPAVNGLVQQGNNQVLDPFGYNCAQNGYGQLDSVYPSHSAQLPWRCGTTGNGNLFSGSNFNSFEPRIGVAWSSANGNTVIRGGFGLFSNQLPVSSVAQLLFNRPTPLNAANPQAIYGQSYLSAYCPNSQCGLGNSSLNGINAQKAGSQIASVPFGVNAIDGQHFSLPYGDQVTFSFQQLITPKLSLELGYVGNFTHRLPVVSNTGFNNEWFCTNSAGQPNPVSNSQYSPNCDNFSYLPVFTLADAGHGNYNSLVVQVHTNDWHGLQMNLAYTYSKALDNASAINYAFTPTSLMTSLYNLQFSGTGNPAVFGLGQGTRFQDKTPQGAFIPNILQSIPNLSGLLNQALTTTGAGRIDVTPYTVAQDPTNYLNNEYGPSDYNVPQRLVIDYAWALPFRPNSNWLGGWMVSGIVIAQSGQPYTIFSGPVFGELTQRVNVTGSVPTTNNPNNYIPQTNNNIVLPSKGCSMDLASPAQSPYVTGPFLYGGTTGSPCIGDTGRNQFGGPAFATFNMALQKTFSGKIFGEGRSLVLRSEFYNLFNRANYYNPISAYSLDAVTTYPQFGEIKSAHDPRQIQFGVRFAW